MNALQNFIPFLLVYTYYMRFNYLAIAFAVLAIGTPICSSSSDVHVAPHSGLPTPAEFRSRFPTSAHFGRPDWLSTAIRKVNEWDDHDMVALFLVCAETANRLNHESAWSLLLGPFTLDRDKEWFKNHMEKFINSPPRFDY